MVSNNNPSGQISLSEYEAKKLLAQFNIPVIKETATQNESETLTAAKKTGFPVVVKGLGSTLLHKTERGLVHLNLMDIESVNNAVQSIKDEAGDELQGFLVQPHIKGKRELVAGMFKDQQFGPVIMLGLGGIFTEALSDVSFKLAPLSETDIEDMIGELKSKALLGSFRGEQPVDMNQLKKVLYGLSALSFEHPEISEIDINPLIVRSTGNVIAVDALVIKETNLSETEYLPPVDPASIGYFFYPKPIAFVGASNTLGKWGHTLPTCTISGGFRGDIYLVNPKGGTILGRKAYKSVKEISGNVDLAVVTVPAAKVMDLIPQFQAKGIKDVLLISSGFSETGEKGKKLEKDLVSKARKAGILILGPNTMGICNPHIHLYCTGVHLKPTAGSTSVLSQSGNMGTQLLAFARQQGIGIRAFCGSGNEAMITIEDFLDAVKEDKKTKTVIIYVESVKNGPRFFKSARCLVKKKPVILLKGGQSKSGNMAAASHTGALSSDSRVFDAMCRQAGIIKVNQSVEMLDLAACFSSLPLPKGNRVAIMTLGGGWGVVTADLCEKYGLEMPPLSEEIINQLDNLLPPYWNRSNPIDLVGEGDNTLPMTVLEELMKWDKCDAVINLGILGKKVMYRHLAESTVFADPDCSQGFLDAVEKTIIKFENEYVEHNINLMCKYRKPVYGVNILSDSTHKTVYSSPDCEFNAVFFPTPEKAVKSLARMYAYHQHLTR